ncbi:LysR family transcriptional regulator [Acidimangrovimonas sediminis]|uniref:LysR family transcriptional regulator n=1 Tax=Acidimangrovimonas sediminis TaxID=2056283 RepID=UPI0018ECACD0|nr:LysR substrate-binding domain-containing protein [Acidimangrovimonas sediminis]
MLRVAQPAVSKTVAQLEEHLGVRLLLRSTHGLIATEAGRNYYDRPRRALEEAELAARGAGTALTDRLRISAAPTFARIHVMPHLGSFLRHHPALEIDVILDDRNIDLIAEGVDVALRMGQLPETLRRSGRCSAARGAVRATHRRAGCGAGAVTCSSRNRGLQRPV